MRGVDAGPASAPCFQSPTSYLEIINACTDATAVAITGEPPCLLPDGGLPSLDASLGYCLAAAELRDAGPNAPPSCAELNGAEPDDNLQVLWTAQAAAPPTSLAAGAANLYWSFEGAVATIPIGGGSMTTLAIAESAGDRLGEVAVDATSLYYSVGGISGGAVVMMPLTGGAATTLATGQLGTPPPSGLLVDATSTFIYWINGWALARSDSESLVRVPISGGLPETLVSGLNDVVSFTVDPLNIYWVSSGTLQAAPLIGGGTTTTLVAPPPAVTSVASDPLNIYYAQGETVALLPKSGGAPITVAIGGSDASQTVTNSTSLLWAWNLSPGTVTAMSLPAGTSFPMDCSGAASSLVVDQQRAYWVRKVGSTGNLITWQIVQADIP
jgi:hypothetical protein